MFVFEVRFILSCYWYCPHFLVNKCPRPFIQVANHITSKVPLTRVWPGPNSLILFKAGKPQRRPFHSGPIIPSASVVIMVINMTMLSSVNSKKWTLNLPINLTYKSHILSKMRPLDGNVEHLSPLGERLAILNCRYWHKEDGSSTPIRKSACITWHNNGRFIVHYLSSVLGFRAFTNPIMVLWRNVFFLKNPLVYF